MTPPFVLNIPNVLTIFRIILVPVFAICFALGLHTQALIVFFIAAITDAIDGFIARRFDMATDFGQAMDPLADKFLMATGVVALTIIGWLPLIFCIVVVLRDLLIFFTSLFLKVKIKNLKFFPSIAGKATTALQVVTIVYAMYFALPYNLGGDFLKILVYFTIILTIFSGTHYFLREMRINKLLWYKPR
ncbi:MAG: CDP-alcohol phosphatidyltransferase family protein [Deltaproteobacteria bacterium]|nr:CDP-alcohol phosphatidyltransferase family protein [Deltaproteobacteria bacterium]